jgi:D-alanyl-D-alanine carboxypeptidase/D-alanyl-D-alanine-endopeptidase (penicillin-binding protein 4)
VHRFGRDGLEGVRVEPREGADGAEEKVTLGFVPVHGGEGTLIRRLRDGDVRGRVRAKTGYIDGVASLAGMVTSKSGKKYAFAFLINDRDIGAAQRTMDQAVSMLARGAADGSSAVSN